MHQQNKTTRKEQILFHLQSNGQASHMCEYAQTGLKFGYSSDGTAYKLLKYLSKVNAHSIFELHQV